MLKIMLVKEIAALICAAAIASGNGGTATVTGIRPDGSVPESYTSGIILPAQDAAGQSEGNIFTIPDGTMNGRPDMQNGMPSGTQNSMPGSENNQNFGGRPGMQNGMPSDMQNNMPGSESGPNFGGRPDTQNGMPSDMQNGMQDAAGEQSTGSVSEALDIVESDVVSSAKEISYSESDAQTVVMSDTNSSVKISESGVYIVTGTCSDGSITVKKGTTGVVLILRDLELASSTGAPLSCNKETEVKIVIEGTVTLTDNEDIADETSSDAETADAFDGAAIKAKDGSDVYLTGTGTLNINGNCKNGIKIGDEDTVFVIDGSMTVNIKAANDGINAGYDLAILSGSISVSAGDDGIHADRVLTVGSRDGSGPAIEINSSYEGIEATVVNLFGGSGTVVSSDDGINAANSDGTYKSETRYAVNITGGTWTVNAGGDGLDSNQDINVMGGSVTIRSASFGGEAGIDYDGDCYIAEGTVTNYSGVAGPDNMMGGGMQGGMNGMNGMQDGMNGNMNGTQNGMQGNMQKGAPNGFHGGRR